MKESERKAQIEIGREEERREGPIHAGIVTELAALRPPIVARKHI